MAVKVDEDATGAAHPHTPTPTSHSAPRTRANARKMSDSDEPIAAGDKEAWLRARGVEIETPEDRVRIAAEKAAALAARTEALERGAPMRAFKYVMIPCDDDAPFVECEARCGLDEAGDVLPLELKSRFAGGGEVDASKVKAQAMRTLGEQGAGVSKEAIMRETKDGSTETFALVRPSEHNGWCGVYLYLDEVGMLKGLPPNRRAGRLAMECGFDGVNFFGDMFIGRVQTKPAPMRSVDFKLSDLDSSAPWMRSATMENVEYSKGLKELEAAMGRNGGMQTINMDGSGGASAGGGNASNMPSGKADGYRWEQTEDEIELIVDVPRGTTSKSVRVLFKPRQVVVKINDETVCDIERLYDAVRPDECTWTMGPDEVCVSMAKTDEENIWRALVADS
jgi:HSP20 family molecular chaperone IbpA